MKYQFVNKKKIRKVNPLREKVYENYLYANEQDKVVKELVIEEKPEYNEETQELFSWFEDGEVITQRFKIVDKEVN